jgi:hypothetical protein
MNQRINQEDSPENRPNFSCEDGTVFIYAKERGLYEPYEKSKEDQDKAGAGERKKSRNPFVKHWGEPMQFWITTIISIATVLVVGVYTYYARQQWYATTQAMKLEERAWVAINTIEPDKPCAWRAISFRNSGRSAALNFRIFGAAEPVSRGAQPSKQEQLLPGKGIIAPDSVFRSCVGGSRTDNLDWSDTDLVIHGRITYDDIFSVEHWTTFCYLRSKDTGFLPCESGNDMDRNGLGINK